MSARKEPGKSRIPVVSSLRSPRIPQKTQLNRSSYWGIFQQRQQLVPGSSIPIPIRSPRPSPPLDLQVQERMDGDGVQVSSNEMSETFTSENHCEGDHSSIAKEQDHEDEVPQVPFKKESVSVLFQNLKFEEETIEHFHLSPPIPENERFSDSSDSDSDEWVETTSFRLNKNGNIVETSSNFKLLGQVKSEIKNSVDVKPSEDEDGDLPPPSLLLINSILVMRDVKDAYTGHLTLTNTTDQLYVFKISCNKPALGKYHTTPNIGCIPPLETVTLEVKMMDQKYTNYLASRDTLVIRGYVIPKDKQHIDPLKLQRSVTRISQESPDVGEKYFVKVMLLPAGDISILDSIRVQLSPNEILEYMKQHRQFSVNKSAMTEKDLKNFIQTVNVTKIQFRKNIKDLATMQIWLLQTRTLGLLAFIFWYLFPLAHWSETASVLYVEPNLDNTGFWSTFTNFFLPLIPAFGWNFGIGKE